MRVDAPNLATERAVLSIESIVSAAGYEARSTSTLLGIAPAASATAVVQTAQETVLQDSAGGVTLLVPPEAAR